MELLHPFRSANVIPSCLCLLFYMSFLVITCDNQLPKYELHILIVEEYARYIVYQWYRYWMSWKYVKFAVNHLEPMTLCLILQQYVVVDIHFVNLITITWLSWWNLWYISKKDNFWKESKYENIISVYICSDIWNDLTCYVWNIRQILNY